MQLRLKHTLGFMSLIAVYAPTEVCGADKKEMVYAKLDSVWISVPAGTCSLPWATSMLSLALRELATSYVLVPMSLVPGTSTVLLNFAKSRRLRIADSWYQRPELYCWTWYSNVGGVAKEIDHIFISI